MRTLLLQSIYGTANRRPARFAHAIQRVKVATNALLALFVITLLFSSVRTAQAHGGVVVAGDLTEKYEWIIQVSPYPVTTPGETFVSLVIYDIKTYQPINGLNVKAYLAPPGSTELCCQPGRDLGPIEIIVDPEKYPGDYSILYDFTPIGQWNGIFVVEDEGGQWTAPFSFLVLPQSLNQFESPLVTPSFVLTSPLASGQTSTLTSTVQADNAAAASQSAGASGPAVDNIAPRGLAGLSQGYLLMLGAGALIPILLLVFWFLRSPTANPNEHDTDEHDTDTRES